MNKKEFIDAEVKKYLTMISEKGYGHTLEDVERRVRAGVAIGNEYHRQLREENEMLRSTLERALNDFKNSTWTDNTYDVVESAIAKSKNK